MKVFRKGSILIEPIIGIIMVMMIGNILVGVSYSNKSHSITEYNLNMHQVVNNEIESIKYQCKGLSSNTCNGIGGIGDYAKCEIPTYTIQDFYGTNQEVNTICIKESDYLVKINTSIVVDGFNYTGEGYVLK